MNIDSIKDTFKSLPSRAHQGLKTVGDASVDYVKQTSGFIKEHIPENFKVQADTFVNSAKSTIKNNKSAFIGGAVVLAAVACATSIIKGVAGKIKQAKQETKIAAHQG